MRELFEVERHIRLIEVFEARWPGGDAFVRPRPYNALSYRITGDALFSDGERELRLSDGAVLFMPAGTPYHLKSGAEELIVVHFELTEPAQTRFSALNDTRSQAVRDSFRELLQIWRGKRTGYELFAAAEFYRLLGHLESLAEDSGGREIQQKIQPALMYIHERFADPSLDIGVLCRLTGLGETQLRKYFMAVCGTTPLKYINEHRVKYACSLMDGSGLSIQDIAAMSGFADAKYFSTVFRKYKGRTPTEYRDGGR